MEEQQKAEKPKSPALMPAPHRVKQSSLLAYTSESWESILRPGCHPESLFGPCGSRSSSQAWCPHLLPQAQERYPCWDSHASGLDQFPGPQSLKWLFLFALNDLCVLTGFFPGTDAVFPPARLEQCKALELQGVRAAEAGDLSTALERFGQAIALLPERASAYNNRAQARRLQGDVAGEGKHLGASC